MRILIVEDNKDFLYFICSIARLACSTNEIFQAETLNEALPHLSNNMDLVISDFEFPIGNFPTFLPYLQKEKCKFILQSAECSHLKTYDSILQVGTVYKDSNYMQNMLKLLRLNYIS